MRENIKDINNWICFTDHFIWYNNECCFYEISINHYDDCTPIETAQASLYEVYLKGDGSKSGIPSIKRELLVKDLPIFELTEIAYKKINKLDNMEWKKLSIEEPKDNERVLVWDYNFKESTIRVFNKEHNSSDTEDGDEYDSDLEKYEFWMKLPEEPKL